MNISTKAGLLTELIASNGTVRMRALGHSMLPTVFPGDHLVIEPVCGGLSRGNIVVYARHGKYVAHRIVSTSSGNTMSVATRGDALAAEDAPITTSDLLGRVRFVVRKGRLIKLADELTPTARVFARLFRYSNGVARLVAGIHRVRNRPQEFPSSCHS